MNGPLSSKRGGSGFARAIGVALVCYACARLLEIVPTAVPRMAIVALDVLSAMTFALLDGTRRYGLRGILIFAAICALVGNVIENIGVATGFPFGHYYFVELMGPKLFNVPILLGLAYIGMAYVSLTLAETASIRHETPLTTTRIFAVSLLAAAIMTPWDLAQDPVWATVLHGWVWRDGGRWFGVPISNYCGWLATNFLIFLLFSFYLRYRPATSTSASSSSARPALLFYALCALGNICQTIPRAIPATVQDPAGKLWQVADITRASALVSLCVMGSFVMIAWLGTRRQAIAATD